ncbi:BspA family leucine-rich repeat surface protein [Segatella copri]|uniref:BspA family leucine-rich repeat surface protein n=1 Tax=Segatella copri TaxID=165179 RepID=UPI002FF17217
MGGAIIRRFALFPLMLLMLLLLPAGMVAQKAASSSKYIATYESSTQTLTFKKNVGETLPKNSAWVEDKMTVATIINNLGNGTIKHIVFDKSFSTYTPTTLYRFFGSLTTLETITDLEYLNTANVTDMHFMFYNCLKLTSLDVTHFNTTKVTNMSYMFFNCSSLTSLDVTHFNTAKVTDMGYMFYNCSSLTTIYASSKFVTPQISKSFNMFYNCKKLKGEEVGWTRDKATDKTYAKIEGGYFSRIPRVKYADGTLTFFLTSKETLGENEYELNSGANPPGWKTHCKEITKVVFEASFANARPTNCYAWFQNFKNLTQIAGIENLNTENVTSMRDMFNGCSSLTSLDLTNFNTAKVTDMKLLFANCSALESLDLSMFNTENVTSMPSMFNGATNLKTLNVSNFNTEKVNNMGHMFANCPNLTSLDLSSFNTKGVEYVDNIFKNCSNLTTIYASENFAFGSGLKNGADMFLGCDKLKGFIEYNKNTDTDKNNSEFANYKTGYFTKLVGKNGDEKIGATGETLATDNLVLDDDKDFVAYEPFAAKAASYNRTVEGTTWATLCLPFDVSLANQNFRAFKLLSADEGTETVELEEIEGSIEAGTPVIIKMKDGATKLNFTVADKEIAKDVQTAETADANYKLQGIYTKKEFSKDTDNNCYIVKGAKLMNPAKLLDKTTTESVGSKPFRAYMVDNSSAPAAGARMFSISVGGSTTAIEQLETTADSKAEYYDLQGRRLQNLQKGVNIVKRGGKTMKVIIK